jgi:hypothetical protein
MLQRLATCKKKKNGPASKNEPKIELNQSNHNSKDADQDKKISRSFWGQLRQSHKLGPIDRHSH